MILVTAQKYLIVVLTIVLMPKDVELILCVICIFSWASVFSNVFLNIEFFECFSVWVCLMILTFMVFS